MSTKNPQEEIAWNEQKKSIINGTMLKNSENNNTYYIKCTKLNLAQC